MCRSVDVRENGNGMNKFCWDNRVHYIRNGIGFIYLEGDPPMHKGTRVSPRDNDYRVFLLFTQVGVKGHSCLLLCLGAT